MIITVSGKTYTAALDPESSVAPKVRQMGWPHPTMRKVGSGTQWVYDVDIERAREIHDHLQMLGEIRMVVDTKVAHAEGRAFLKDASRIKRLLPREGR